MHILNTVESPNSGKLIKNIQVLSVKKWENLTKNSLRDQKSTPCIDFASFWSFTVLKRTSNLWEWFFTVEDDDVIQKFSDWINKWAKKHF